jgi:hypothetical protein
MSCTFTINRDGTVHAWHLRANSDMPFGRVSLTEVVRGLREWEAGALIQDALPFLDADRREFIMTGMTPAMWNEMFPENCG